MSRAGDEEFIQLLWATHVLQTDNPDPARRYLRSDTIPNGAIRADMPNQYSIYKWELETLANELMTVPKIKPKKNGPTRVLRWDHFGASLECVNWLRKLEKAEYRIQKKRRDILIEMGRIAARQFDWQRGFVNLPQFYRNAFVYGQGVCAKQFEETNGITLNRFSEIGFMLFVALSNSPVVRNDNSLRALGTSWEEVETVLSLIALDFPKAAKLARTQRRNTIHTSDKASILRQAPCLRFGDQGERIRAPLPELILERVTSGVFYDVVKGGGPVRDDYGKRFEEYSLEHLRKSLGGLSWQPEFQYRKKPNTLDTPDILCERNGQISLAIECKATRMSHEAMFGANPLRARGYQDLIKAVFQLWRFFSHCRRGYVGRTVDDEAVGVVLTLDNWLVMSDSLRKHVLKDAENLARNKDREILEIDRKSIVFVAMPELERTLSMSTEASFIQALGLTKAQKYRGWRLDSVLKDLVGNSQHPKKKYPFSDELGNLLPWWDEYGD